MKNVLIHFWRSYANRALVALACFGSGVNLVEVRPDFVCATLVALFFVARRLDDAVGVCRGFDQ